MEKKEVKALLKHFRCLIPLGVGLVLFFALPYFPWVAEHIFSGFLFKIIVVPIGFIIGLLPFSLTEMVVVLSPVLVLALITLFVVKLVKSKQKRQFMLKIGKGVTWVVGFVFLQYMLTHGANFHRYSLPQLMSLDMTHKDTEFLYDVTVHIAKMASLERENVRLDENGNMTYTENQAKTLSLANNGYENLADEYPFLKWGVTQPKKVIHSRAWSSTMILGVYFPFWAEANVNTDFIACAVPFNAAHELAHTKGFAREDECNFLAFLSATNSDYVDYRYAGYLEAFRFLINDLAEIDFDLAMKAAEHLSDGAKSDYNSRAEYWQKLREEAEEMNIDIQAIMTVAHDTNDAFISAQGVEDGAKSYSRMVDVVLAYYEKNGF